MDGFWSEDFPYPKAKELGERYYKKYDKHSVSIGTYYALCQTLWKAIEVAGTLDSAKVRQAVPTLSSKGRCRAMSNIDLMALPFTLALPISGGMGNRNWFIHLLKVGGRSEWRQHGIKGKQKKRYAGNKSRNDRLG